MYAENEFNKPVYKKNYC